jgi:hypothetical protein
MSKRLPLIAGAAVVVLAGGYFGLCAYSSQQEEQQLREWAYETGLDEYLSWQSVSSSPLGGRVTISGLELDFGKTEPRLQAAELVISERRIDEQQSRVRLQFNGLSADERALGGLRSLGARAGGSLGRGLGRASPDFAPALNSGLAEFKPFDVELFVDIDDKAGTLATELSVNLPELFSTHIAYQLNNVRDLHRDLQRLSEQLGDDKAGWRLLNRDLPELVQNLERAEISEARFGIKDLGMAQRSIALYQRYNTPLDPAAGNVESQRSEHYARVVEEAEQNCNSNRDELPKGLEDSCELLGKFLRGKIDGVELSIEPEERVRLGDLFAFDNPKRMQRTHERLNPQIDSL